ncbi:hypothetical protein ACRBEV_25450 [Methylobacterium phyllosphaerae]
MVSEMLADSQSEIDADLTEPYSLGRWYFTARNRLDYLRRQDQSWRGVGLTVWLSSDNRVRGIVGLGGNSPERFIEAFDRWRVSLRPVSEATLRTEITAIKRPDGRLQSGIKLGKIEWRPYSNIHRS